MLANQPPMTVWVLNSRNLHCKVVCPVFLISGVYFAANVVALDKKKLCCKYNAFLQTYQHDPAHSSLHIAIGFRNKRCFQGRRASLKTNKEHKSSRDYSVAIYFVLPNIWESSVVGPFHTHRIRNKRKSLSLPDVGYQSENPKACNLRLDKPHSEDTN